MAEGKSKPAPISDILKDVFRLLESEKQITSEEIERLWFDAAGTKAARHSKPIKLAKEVLTVQVDSSVWLHELSMQKRSILKNLKKFMGKDKIADVHFKIGEL